ncbi:MAG: 50S ribosomal protein L4 [Deltaproteobacteria bacterium]|nr:50S ribosomal protein L4 [Deltaproteobacteria bacterium]
MMELKILNSKKEVVGKENVDEAIFKAEFRPHLMHDYVVMQRRALRQGTASTKTRAEVSGTGKKPFKQKGTGHARQGTLIGPHQPGGGIAFGPKPHKYSSNLNRKAKIEALRVALSQKNYEGKLAILDKFEIKSGKTKEAFKILSGFSDRSTLLIGDLSTETKRSMQNLASSKFLSPEGLNVMDLLKFDQILITKDSLAKVNDRLKVVATKKTTTKKASASKGKVAA